MSKRILIIQGHPDASAPHFCHALVQAYLEGAERGGHVCRVVDVAALDFPVLRSQAEWEHGMLPTSLRPAQLDLAWCEHIVIVFPLWLGDMPALLKAFLEQVARPGFAFKAEGGNPLAKKGLTGRSARVVCTMGMPALLYRYFFRAHSIKSLERNILGFVGIGPIHESLIGQVANLDESQRWVWLGKLRKLGKQGA